MTVQNKDLEKEFFDRYGDDGYDRFSETGYEKLISLFQSSASPNAGEVILDLGCGSGAFTLRLQKTYPLQKVIGIDISSGCIERASQKYSAISFRVGDVESTGLPTASVDIVCFAGVLHHFPSLELVAKEAFRILKPGGRFFAFDPHHYNPAFWLYRCRQSPFYSPVGVTANERLLTSKEVTTVFSNAGFEVRTQIISGISFSYVESQQGRRWLAMYNFLDAMLGATPLARIIGAWLITSGNKV